jgi:transposase
VTIDRESIVTVVGCAMCGTRARAKDHRWVSVRDAPNPDRAVVLRIRKRIWSCPEPACAGKTWTEHCDLVAPRRVLAHRADEWATDRVAAIEGTPASLARALAVSWPTVWMAIERCAAARRADASVAIENPLHPATQTRLRDAGFLDDLRDRCLTQPPSSTAR